jgi:uncharacterized protein
VELLTRGIERELREILSVSRAAAITGPRAKLGARFKTGILVYSGEHTPTLSDRVWALPLSGLWQAQ